MISPILLAVLAAIGGLSVEPEVRLENGRLYVVLPPGIVGKIYIQRNGVDIPAERGVADVLLPAAVSADGVGAYEYIPRDADKVDGVSLTPRVINIRYETNPPRLYSLRVTEAEPFVVLATYDENLLESSVPHAAAFSIPGNICLEVAVAGNVVRCTYANRFVPGQVPMQTYTPGAIKIVDRAHVPNAAPGYTSAVFCEFPEPATPVMLRTTESNYAVGGGGFVNVTGTGQAFVPRMEEYGLIDDRATNFPPIINDDGWVECQVSDSNAALRIVGLGEGEAYGIGNAIHIQGGVATVYVGSTSTRVSHTFASPSSLCRVRVRRVVPSGRITADFSEDGGVSWTTFYTYSGKSTAQGIRGAFYTASSTVAIVGAAMQGATSQGF